MLNPDVFQKARAEIDRVVGTDRLPALSDRPKLRYIDYIVEETTRWRPLSPIGIPHKSLQDDIYNGHLIPKGLASFSTRHSLEELGSLLTSCLSNIEPLSTTTLMP